MIQLSPSPSFWVWPNEDCDTDYASVLACPANFATIDAAKSHLLKLDLELNEVHIIFSLTATCAPTSLPLAVQSIGQLAVWLARYRRDHSVVSSREGKAEYRQASGQVRTRKRRS